MSSDTRWLEEWNADIAEQLEATAKHALHVWPHAWPASTHPDGTETGNPAPRGFNPEPPVVDE